jgi:DNA-directed RNA polymerase specialized sigma subunit
MPEREASIVKWHYADDISFADIAARLGVSTPRISQLHARAMCHMRSLLGDLGNQDWVAGA